MVKHYNSWVMDVTCKIQVQDVRPQTRPREDGDLEKSVTITEYILTYMSVGLIYILDFAIHNPQDIQTPLEINTLHLRLYSYVDAPS